ncbi:MAG: GGDEF domain-containing protein [Pseudomonadota bacterium]
MVLSDNLIGLHNRRYLSNHLDSLLARAAETGRPLGLLMIDVDFFKSVNDTHRHAAGDEVLRAVANRLMYFVRGLDSVARWGGEEFAVVIPDADAAIAGKVAERLRRAVANPSIAISTAEGGREPRVTVSIGWALSGPGLATQDGLLRAADAALYEAKRSGRNRVVRAGEGEGASPALVALA